MIKSFKISFFRASFIYMTLVLLSTISCTKDEQLDLFVDSSLQEYFDRFAVEGAKRNVIVDYTAARVSGYLDFINTPHVVGQCAHDKNKPNRVTIDAMYWDGRTDLEREFLVFHELGHCVLNREHMDDADAQGNCVSIMTSGSAQCRIHYTQDTREKLLDELFMK